MRMPIKLNKAYWPKAITNLLPSAADPRVLLDGEIHGEDFSKAVSVFKFGTTFKTTTNFRFPITISELKSLDYPSPLIVLDIGASDGITSINLIENIDVRKMYVTDLNMELFFRTFDGKSYFYDIDNTCILIVTNMFVIYSDFRDAIFPFNRISKAIFSKVPDRPTYSNKLQLINPDVVKSDFNIIIERYDIFTKWMHEKVDLIIAANLLNRNYFSDKQIIQALENILDALNNQGRCVIVDSRKIEKGTIFRVVDGSIEAEKDINGGTEIQELVLQAFPKHEDVLV